MENSDIQKIYRDFVVPGLKAVVRETIREELTKYLHDDKEFRIRHVIEEIKTKK